ncbi:hypothetical protein CEXT_545281 [Caerostris extrusa]|uniref:Uncharacterized protein n=1 Tax=Caerostris extrusa TaxID=172846 RepID=A0AAV4M921_CAEEX|nr:hypothetical protein CEXT_545281 [Caerostris extrusa]
MSIKPSKHSVERIPPASPSDIVNNAKSIEVKKVPNFDSITFKVLKKLPYITIIKLYPLVNKFLVLEHFSYFWKTATIIPFLKSGKNSTNPVSILPITLHSSLSEIAESIIPSKLINLWNLTLTHL